MFDGKGPSVVILVQNEEFFLPYVLTQIEGIFDRVIIYDVASTDGTRKIIDWWEDRVKNNIELFIRRIDTPVSPIAQGAFRNAMILEGKREVYFILDGDECYTPGALAEADRMADDLDRQHTTVNEQIRYGVFKRVEVSMDLRQQYVERRSHHRLYTKDAYWKGTHPGEEPIYKQNAGSEMYYNVTCFHMHNTIRSTKDKEALKRIERRRRKTYHPGTEVKELNLLDELPMLQKPIEDFPVSPALAALQAEWQA